MSLGKVGEHDESHRRGFRVLSRVTRAAIIAVAATAMLGASMPGAFGAEARPSPRPTAKPPAPVAVAPLGGAAIVRGRDGLWRMPLRHFGYHEVRLRGLIATAEIFAGIPEGLTPVALQGVMQISPDVLSGYVEFRSGEDVLATESLSRRVHLGQGHAVSVPLDGVHLRNRTLALSFYARIRTTDDACEAAVIGTRVDLLKGTLVLRGTGSPPRAVGGFLPKTLSRLRVFIPADPNPAEATAALGIATAVIDRYTGQQTAVGIEEVTVGPLPAIPFHPFERTIVLRRGGPGGMRLQGAGTSQVLVVSGSTDAIARQADAFARDLGALALGPSVSVLQLQQTDDVMHSRVTFEDLGVRPLQASGVGRVEIPVPFSQYDLGGARNLKVRLVGVYTPVTQGGSATLGLLVNGVLVRAVTLGTSGTFDLELEVAADLARRENTLLVRVDYGPPEGVCRLGIRPFTFDLSKGSYFDVGDRSALGEGFLRFPQVFRDGFVVSFDRISVPDVQAALNILASLQRLAGSALRPRVVPWEQGLRERLPAIFIGNDAARVRALKPPIDPHPFKVTDASGTTVLEMDVDSRFAVLAAFRQGRRDVLLLTGRNPGALGGDLVRGLELDPDGWFGLTGDVYLLADGSSPVNLNLRARALRAKAISEKTAGVGSFRLAPLLAATVVAFVGLTFLYPRLVRRAPDENKG